MTRWLDQACKAVEAVIALLLAAMVVRVFGNVVLRYGFNSGITISEELSRWFFVWMTFLGAIVGVKEHGHLGTDMLVGRLGPIGTHGSLSVPTMRLKKSYPRPGDRSWWKPFEEAVVGMVRDDPLKHQIEHFGAVVRGEAEPLVSARDGLKNLRLAEAIAQAAASGRVIEIPRY